MSLPSSSDVSPAVPSTCLLTLIGSKIIRFSSILRMIKQILTFCIHVIEHWSDVLLQNGRGHIWLQWHNRRDDFPCDDLLQLILLNRPCRHFNGQDTILGLVSLRWEGDLDGDQFARIENGLKGWRAILSLWWRWGLWRSRRLPRFCLDCRLLRCLQRL